MEKKPPSIGTSARARRRSSNTPCLVVENSQLCGGQVHFYMETQACIAIPTDEGRITMCPSTQSPMGMHATTAMALGLQYHQVELDVPPVGGGFGGKTEQTRFVTGPTAVAAKAIKGPVRVAVPRDEDTAMIGKRHAYYGQYQIAVDRQTGIIHGFELKMWGDGGAFYDCSFIVSNCIQLRTDNAYRIANFQSQIDVCRTNTAPSTAMRAFGDVQGKNMRRKRDRRRRGRDRDAARGFAREEPLRRGDVTPFGQALSYCYMKQVWDYVKEVSKFEEKYQAGREVQPGKQVAQARHRHHSGEVRLRLQSDCCSSSPRRSSSSTRPTARSSSTRAASRSGRALSPRRSRSPPMSWASRWR